MTPTTPISPKVATGALAGASATLIVACAALLGIELPPGVGEAVGTLLGSLAVVVAAWAKRDPLRDAGQLALRSTDEIGPESPSELR